METKHEVFLKSATNMKELDNESVDLVVTSPPYPMIEMWDEIFTLQDSNIGSALKNNKAFTAFELMHLLLDRVWEESIRVLKQGGFICINIGDATRNIGSNFKLYPNHSRIISYLLKKNMDPLPLILWRKQTNSPNKFMGSGMLPAGAYVTLEHEYILIFRKGGKKSFRDELEKKRRKKSAFFWEERNLWYSDIWTGLNGVQQKNGNGSRAKSAAFPFELVNRLILMFSLKGDTVLDPFMGTGNSMVAAMATARNSVGYEIDSIFGNDIKSTAKYIVDFSKTVVVDRIAKHLSFVASHLKNNKVFKYTNNYYGFPVKTKQEQEMSFHIMSDITEEGMLKFKGHHVEFGTQYLNNSKTFSPITWEKFKTSK